MMTPLEELNTSRKRRAIMDAAANCWDPVEGKRLANLLREACNGHPNAKIAWPHRLLHEAADALETKANSHSLHGRRVVEDLVRRRDGA